MPSPFSFAGKKKFYVRVEEGKSSRVYLATVRDVTLKRSEPPGHHITFKEPGITGQHLLSTIVAHQDEWAEQFVRQNHD